jgi:hypothetical protein
MSEDAEVYASCLELVAGAGIMQVALRVFVIANEPQVLSLQVPLINLQTRACQCAQTLYHAECNNSDDFLASWGAVGLVLVKYSQKESLRVRFKATGDNTSRNSGSNG